MQMRGNLHRYRVSPVRKKKSNAPRNIHVCPVIALY